MPHARPRKLGARLAYKLFQLARVMGAGRLSKLGSPRTVIDIGVAAGTPELYKAFPQADLLLIEPLAEYEPHLKAICAKRSNAKYVLAAVGASPETRHFQVVPRLLEHSSFLSRTPLATQEPGVENRAVQITTLDAVVANLAATPPYGIKIDTEGFELDVIRGATKVLEQTQFVIAEVSILKRFEGSYLFSDFVAAMTAHGFEAFDILNVVRPDASGTRYADIAFINTRNK